MTKIPLHLLCFTSVFLCFFPTTSPTSLLNSKDQLPCTMCDTCDNPCHPPYTLPPPPPPPEPECPPPPPPPALPPSIEPQCPPPPAPASPAIYYYSPPPPSPPATPASPETYYYSPPPPPTPPYGGGGGCGGCYGGLLPPPNSVVPYFPYSNLYPPSQNYHSSSSTLEVYFIASFSIIFLPLILG